MIGMMSPSSNYTITAEFARDFNGAVLALKPPKRCRRHKTETDDRRCRDGRPNRLGLIDPATHQKPFHSPLASRCIRAGGTTRRAPATLA